MSAAIVKAIRQRNDLRRSVFKAAEELGLAADEEGLTPPLSYRDLAERMHFSPRTAKRRIADLLHMGFCECLPNILSTVEVAGQTLYRYAKNRYRILIDFERQRPRFTSARMFTCATWSFFAWLLDKMAQILQNPSQKKDLKDLKEGSTEQAQDAKMDEAERLANLAAVKELIANLSGQMRL